MLRVRIDGDAALFCNPHFRADPLSYPVPTPSALKGTLRAIYWKPEFEIEIDSFRVLKPIRFDTSKAKSVKKPGPSDRTLTTTTFLVDVAYEVDFRIAVNPMRSRDPVVRYEQEFLRRLKRGQCFSQPFLGRSDFAARVTLAGESEACPIADSRFLGRMLFDLLPGDPLRDEFKPIFYSPMMKDGCVIVPESLYAKYRGFMFRQRDARHAAPTFIFDEEGVTP